MPLSPRPAAPNGPPVLRPPARRGFTLVELLVAATLGLLVAAAVSTLLVSQLRAFARAQGATAVQRDLRLGLALLPMDLRGASRADGDLLDLTSTSAELRATIASSVVCDVVGAGTTTTTLLLPPTDLPSALLTAYFATPLAGDMVKLLIRPTAGGDQDRWLTGVVGGGSTAPWSAWPAGAAPAPTGLCAAAGTPGVSSRIALPVLWPIGTDPKYLALITTGMPVRVLRRVKYELYDAGSGRWFLGYRERTGNAWPVAPEPVAGPYAATPASGTGSGVSFAYFDTSNVAIPAPVSLANLTRVGRIDVTLRPRTEVRAGAGKDSVVARDSALVRVALRNRI